MSVAKKPAFWAITIAISFFVINLAQIGRYGLSYDEPSGMERGRETVALVAGLVRPTDEEENGYRPGWLHNHPPLYATCNYGVARVLTQIFHWQPIPAGHFLNLLTASAGLVLLFYLGKLLFNPLVGLTAEIFMVCFPRFIAHAHFNGKDVPVMVMGTLALLLLNVAAQRGKTRYWILAGLGIALAGTTKLDGLFVLPIFLIPWLTRSLQSENRFADLRKLGWCLGTSVIFIFLLWPQLWKDPLHLFHSVSNFAGEFRTKEVSYLGQTYPMAHLPWHYNLVEFIAVTPLLWLLVAGAGAGWSLWNLLHRRAVFAHGLLWCWILVPVLPRMLPGIIRYEGMRHIFIIVPAVALMAGLAVDQLLAFWKSRAGYKLAPVVLCGALAWSGWQILECHPYEAFYLNEPVRAVVPAPKFGEYFDFFGWGTLYTQGVDWVNGHAPPQATVSMGNDSEMLRSHGLRQNLETVDNLDQADYVLVGCWSGVAMDRFHSPPAYSVSCYGVNLLCVFEQHRP